MKQISTNTPFSLFDELKKNVEKGQEVKGGEDYKVLKDIHSNPYDY